MNKIEQLKVVEKPWGRELWFAQTSNYMGKILEIDPGKSTSIHKHEIKEETMYVFQGRCQVLSKDDIRIYYPGSFIHIEPGDVHSMTATGDTGQRVILFEVSTPFPEDSIRLEDKYSRPCVKEAQQK